MLEKQEGAVREQERGGDEAHRMPVSLSGEINTATRTLHTSLNRLITSRLPLALPPHHHDPSLYTTGLLHFAHIFLTFESLWADLVRDHTQPHNEGTASPPFSPLLSYLLVNPYDAPSLFTSTLGAPTPPSPQLVSFLRTLRPKGMVRSSRLKRDLEFLLDVHPTDLEVVLATYPGDQVADFCTHIRKAVGQKPWVLLAYAWCFYMAIFSGGRWIRGGLLRAPEGFWSNHENVERLEDRGLSFWHFPGEVDGEDIKAEFKMRLLGAEELLSPDQRVDIIEEAKNVFRMCAGLVEELDNMVGTDMAMFDAPKGVSEKQPLDVVEVDVSKSADNISVKGFLRRPEITGMLVAMGCLACVTLLRFQ